MKIYKHEETDNEIVLGESQNIVELKVKSYSIRIEAKDKNYDMLEGYICDAIAKGLEVYEATSIMGELEICNEKLINSHLPVFVFYTTDKNKFNILDDIIRNILIFYTRLDTRQDTKQESLEQSLGEGEIGKV